MTEYRTPRYQAVNYPGMGVTFDAVTEDGKVHALAGMAAETCRMWNICDCRRYALDGGFTNEQSFRTPDGCYEVHWYLPE